MMTGIFVMALAIIMLIPSYTHSEALPLALHPIIRPLSPNKINTVYLKKGFWGSDAWGSWSRTPHDYKHKEILDCIPCVMQLLLLHSASRSKISTTLRQTFEPGSEVRASADGRTDRHYQTYYFPTSRSINIESTKLPHKHNELRSMQELVQGIPLEPHPVHTPMTSTSNDLSWFPKFPKLQLEAYKDVNTIAYHYQNK